MKMRFLNLALTLTTLTTISPALAETGNEGGGGGTFTAADFVSQARELQSMISGERAWDKIGVDAEAFDKAVSSTNVFCAVGDRLTKMRAQGFDAYYVPALNSIYLVCAKWTKSPTAASRTTLFHEYMRVLRKEDSSYSVSSLLGRHVKLTGKPAGYYYDDMLERAIHDGDMAGIFQAVEGGARLNGHRPAIREIVCATGASEVLQGGVRMDHLTGPIFSVDEKVALIAYLKVKGANVNAKDSLMNEGSMHCVFDAVVMNALIDAGADVLATGRNGTQPLIGFLFGYQNYPNKAYFRYVVERMLKAGANTKDEFGDKSGNVLSVAQKYGDSDLVSLISKYSR